MGPELSCTLMVSPSVTLRTVPTRTGMASSVWGRVGAALTGGRGAVEGVDVGCVGPGATGAATQPASRAATSRLVVSPASVATKETAFRAVSRDLDCIQAKIATDACEQTPTVDQFQERTGVED